MHQDVVGQITINRAEPYLDARDLDALIVEWLDDCADRLDGFGPNGYTGTVAGYAAHVDYFRRWWVAEGPQCGWRLTKSGLRAFERWLRLQESQRGEPLAYNTRRDALRRLRAMLRWGQRENYLINAAPADWVPSAAGDPPVRRPLSEEQLAALMAAAALTSAPVRNITILAVLIGTGIRRAECARLDIEDVSFADGYQGGALLIRHPKRTRRGAVVREAAFDAATADYLLRWLVAQAREAGPLFPSSRGGGYLSPMGLGRIVRSCWQLAGISVDQPVHSLRYAFITSWRRQHQGDDMDDLLRRQVGHADAAMTSHYSLQGVEDVIRALESPVARLGVRVTNWPTSSPKIDP